MKNLILIISLMVCSYNTIGAAKFSYTGLEGWGKKGVGIVIEDYSKDDKNFPLKSIRTKVELRLRQAGIKVVDKFAGADIVIDAQPVIIGDRIFGHAVSINAGRLMEFKAPDNTGILETYTTYANSKRYGGMAPAGGLVNQIDSLMDNLLLDCLKENPKK